ncbi:transporter substrate-binding domain-containing protein [Thiotrichales bacterium 19X7-9]|nr:transporter substrate-binding domain-containing protein [Thiotrichales bacterium 19X7-9]
MKNMFYSLVKVSLLLIILFMMPLSLFADNENSQIKACAEPWPPFDYIEHGKTQGINVHMNQQTFESLNIPLKIIIMPWKQCWKLVQNGKIDVALMVSKKQQRQVDVYYSSLPTDKLHYVWVTNSNTNNNKICQQSICPDLETNDWKVGLVEGNSYSKELLACLNQKKNANDIIYQPTLSSAVRKLLADQIQLVPTVKSIAEYFKEQLEIHNLHVCQNTLFSKDYYTVFSRKSAFKSEQYLSIEAVKTAYDQVLTTKVK